MLLFNVEMVGACPNNKGQPQGLPLHPRRNEGSHHGIEENQKESKQNIPVQSIIEKYKAIDLASHTGRRYMYILGSACSYSGFDGMDRFTSTSF